MSVRSQGEGFKKRISDGTGGRISKKEDVSEVIGGGLPKTDYQRARGGGSSKTENVF
jgi:hypothetical protein